MKEDHRQPHTAGKNVGIWIRVSTEEQAQGDSPKHHEIRARGYAEARGWKVREVYNLAGVSGKTVMEHPECKRMMADIKRRHITGLLFSNLFRLCRNKWELEDFSKFFQANDADMVSILDTIDTSTPMGRMFFTFRAAQGHWEREEIAGRVAVSVPIRAKLGKPMGGLAPFGYEWKDKKLVPHPQDAAVRKLVYELFAEHKRKKTVARILNERGFRTRDGKTRKGGKFSDTTVTRLLTDTTAKGDHRANYTKSRGDGRGWVQKPEHEWTVNRVEPIVSADLWERCNALLEDRKTKGERPAKRGKMALSDFVRCYCGKKMYVPFESPKWICLACRNKVPVADLDALFREEIKGFMVSPAKVESYLVTALGEIAIKNDLLAGLRKERDRVKAEADKCFELYQAGALSVAQFKERFQPLDTRKHEIEREVARLEGEMAALSTEEVSCERVAAEAHNFYDAWPTMTEDRKRAVAELILETIVVGKDDIAINLFNLPVFRNDS